ncbi:hypothetical protein J4H92_04285 [Leucobacter weissii]|uniref:Uncharacterized protein n=1 Tax=Leucobacter weissii TaxID=1983706 RepID=A0A939S7N2_9MICO|nr:hypothetical protein [Leucobacter weissii]MBO1901166.1 hypothetical protein [Leucobacter weissii]
MGERNDGGARMSIRRALMRSLVVALLASFAGNFAAALSVGIVNVSNGLEGGMLWGLVLLLLPVANVILYPVDLLPYALFFCAYWLLLVRQCTGVQPLRHAVYVALLAVAAFGVSWPVVAFAFPPPNLGLHVTSLWFEMPWLVIPVFVVTAALLSLWFERRARARLSAGAQAQEPLSGRAKV